MLNFRQRLISVFYRRYWNMSISRCWVVRGVFRDRGRVFRLWRAILSSRHKRLVTNRLNTISIISRGVSRGWVPSIAWILRISSIIWIFACRFGLWFIRRSRGSIAVAS
eukprot:NODE_305_length_10201_cov_0.856464.p10 type:complete len:109 gc:universal NODE_305_length_10201_cov_0.856464:1062-736(-)